MAHCTNCGASLRENDKFCAGCGSAASPNPISAAGAPADHKNVATLMGMARTAELGTNNAEALEYYNRVLEIDPTIAEAWIGKGRSASWQSTLANFRVSEGLVAFQHAISNAGDDREASIETVVDELNRIVTALYRMARNHLEEFASLDQVWLSYLNQVAQMLDALEQALKWSPRNITTLENIVHLTKDNIEGYKYWDSIHQVSGLHGVSQEYEKTLRNLMDKAISTLREVDENYAAPTVTKKQADACFVVTATLGDANHPDVVLLRRFRDDWIATRSGGPSVITWYYRVGPHLAAWIEQSQRRRSVAYKLVVQPAVRFAKGRLHRSR